MALEEADAGEALRDEDPFSFFLSLPLDEDEVVEELLLLELELLEDELEDDEDEVEDEEEEDD